LNHKIAPGNHSEEKMRIAIKKFAQYHKKPINTIKNHDVINSCAGLEGWY